MTPASDSTANVTALAGGVGAAKLLRGLVRAHPPERLTTIVNTGDDREFYGVHVSPDIDIVLYTLAGIVHPKNGFGLDRDRFEIVDRLSELGHETWFRLGDRDFAQCLHRTLRLRDGRRLSQITEELRVGHDLAMKLLPMSDDPCPTYVELEDGRRLHFEEYLVRERSPDSVKHIDLDAAQRAEAAPGVIEAIEGAHTIVLCPSNPVVSIGPILAVKEVRRALCEARVPIVAVSPIVAGAAVKGPAEQLLRGTGNEVSARGIAALYRDFLGGIVIDERDEELAASIADMGIRVAVTDTLMRNEKIATDVASEALRLAQSLRESAP